MRILLLFFCLLLSLAAVGATTPAQEPLPGLVLLPVQGSGVTPGDKRLYVQALARALGGKYRVYSGEEVERKLEHAVDRTCDSSDCRQSIVRDFAARLLGRAVVSRVDAGYVINVEIRDMAEQRAVLNDFRDCPRCSRDAVANVLAQTILVRPDEAAKRAEAYAESESWEGFAALILDSEPSGADVYIDGLRVGATPYRDHRQRAGRRLSIALKLADHRDTTINLPIKDGSNELSVHLTPAFGALAVTSHPSGATVRLDGQTVGVTPWRAERVGSGQHRLALGLALHAPVEERLIEIRDGRQDDFAFELEPRYATLTVAGSGEMLSLFDPSGVEVRRDKAPAEVRIEPGNYTLEISREGHEIRRLDIAVTAGQTLALDPERTALRKLEGTLVVTTRPYVRGAEVLVDGQVVGRVPLTLKLPVGMHQLAIASAERIGEQTVEVGDRGSTSAVVPLVARPKPGPGFRDCPECPEMVRLPAGRFMMGANGGSSDEKPVHRVAIPAFSIGKNEVTRGQWTAFVKETGYLASDTCLTFEGGAYEEQSQAWRGAHYTLTDEHPVVCVNWDDAQAYVAWLAHKTGKAYRLPSEAEWEYAARAGSVTSRHWGNVPEQACRFANVMDQTGKAQVPRVNWAIHACNDRQAYTAPVGRYRPNGFGLYDMIGNVWEWTEDCGNDNYIGAPVDGSAWTRGDCGRRVLRGGAWNVRPANARSSTRYPYVRSYRNDFNGFRVAVSSRPRNASPLVLPSDDCALCRELIVLPGGTFDMGVRDGSKEEMPARKVVVAPFRIGKTEVTQAQWRAVMGNSPSRYKDCDDCPVEHVSWNEVQEFLKTLNERTRQRFRLPSEAEWEYACRAGRMQKFCGGDDLERVAWVAGNSRGKTHLVGRKLPNAFGLFDMTGNVWEWVQDCWHDSHAEAPADGTARDGECRMRVARGASWLADPVAARPTRRHGMGAAIHDSNGGFRLAAPLPAAD